MVKRRDAKNNNKKNSEKNGIDNWVIVVIVILAALLIANIFVSGTIFAALAGLQNAPLTEDVYLAPFGGQTSSTGETWQEFCINNFIGRQAYCCARNPGCSFEYGGGLSAPGCNCEEGSPAEQASYDGCIALAEHQYTTCLGECA
jgi:hypothetical protein